MGLLSGSIEWAQAQNQAQQAQQNSYNQQLQNQLGMMHQAAYNLFQPSPQEMAAANARSLILMSQVKLENDKKVRHRKVLLLLD